MKKKIVILLSNEILNDPRVFRAAKTLAVLDAEICIYCRRWTGGNPSLAYSNGLIIHRIKVRAYIKYLKGLLKMIACPLLGKLGLIRNSLPTSGSDLSYISTVNEQGSRQILSLKDIRILFGIMRFNLLLFFKALTAKSNVYYANDLDTLPAAFLLSRLYGGRLVFDAHELYAEQFSDYSVQYKKFLTWLEEKLIRKADKVITVNDSIAGILSERYKINRPEVILSCPIYIDAGAKKKDRDERKVKIIYQGIYNAERGLEELVLSAKHIRDGLVYFRGYGNVEVTLKRLVAENRLGDKVFLLEPVRMQDIVISLEGMDIGVGAFNSRALNSYYCLPNKIFEYMMAGLALAVSDLPELRKIVEQCENGVLFNPSDPKDIAEKINFLIDNPNELEKMKTNSLKWAKVYSWEREGEKLKAMINELLKSS